VVVSYVGGQAYLYRPMVGNPLVKTRLSQTDPLPPFEIGVGWAGEAAQPTLVCAGGEG